MSFANVLKGISAGLPIVGSVLGAIDAANARRSNEELNRRAEQFQYRMWENQGNRELNYWRMQNEYNSPIKQMERLKQAGLNPNLVYGNGADAQGATMRAGGAPSVPNYRAENLNLNSIVDQTLAIQQAKANVAQTKAQTDAIQQNTAIGQFELAARQSIGQDAFTRLELGKMQALNSKNSKEVMEYDAWFDAVTAGADSDTPISVNFLGSYQMNPLVKKAMSAGLMTTIEQLKSIKAGTTLRTQQADINESKKIIMDMEAKLSQFGMNKGQIAPIILSLIKLITRK